jgi:hypothetical protein
MDCAPGGYFGRRLAAAAGEGDDRGDHAEGRGDGEHEDQSVVERAGDEVREELASGEQVPVRRRQRRQRPVLRQQVVDGAIVVFVSATHR